MTASDCLTIGEVVSAARASMNADAWDELVGATSSQATARNNRDALDRIALRPRVLVGATDVDPSTVFLGRRLSIPVLLANVGDGATNPAFDTLAFVSAAQMRSGGADNTRSIVEVSVHDDPDRLERDLDLARTSGCPAVCLSVVPPTGTVTRRLQNVWARVDAIVAGSTQPLIAKGIMDGDDARRALDHGCASIYVSNYGGRSLDHCLATIDVLPDVVDAVGGRGDVIVDGGFIGGTDILKALGLGATAIVIGRLQCCGLAVGGPAGLDRVLCILEDELRTSMALLGTPTVGAITRNHLFRGGASCRPHAYPSLELEGTT